MSDKDDDLRLLDAQSDSCSTSYFDKDDDLPIVKFGSTSTAYGQKEEPILLDDSPPSKVPIIFNARRMRTRVTVLTPCVCVCVRRFLAP